MSVPVNSEPIEVEVHVKVEYTGADEVIDVDALELAAENAELENQCSICLQQLVDKTVIPGCSHSFCFECICVWSEQSRSCPLCSRKFGIGDNMYLIHHIRGTHDYTRHFLLPLPSTPRSNGSSLPSHIHAIVPQRRRAQAEREWGRQRDTHRRAMEELDDHDRAVAKRRWVYRHDLYARHVASNSFTRYKPCPTPAQFTASAELQSRTAAFVRRELMVWVCPDLEFLTNFVISLMKAIDIRSESAVKLLAEFLDMDDFDGLNTASSSSEPARYYRNAEHFAHEVYCYLRSPYRDIKIYDSVVQYDDPNVPPPTRLERSDRWRPRKTPRSRSRSRQHDRSRNEREPRVSSRERRRMKEEREQERWGSGSKRRRTHDSPSRSRSRSRTRNRQSRSGSRRRSHSHSRNQRNGDEGGSARADAIVIEDEADDELQTSRVKGKEKAEAIVVDSDDDEGKEPETLATVARPAPRPPRTRSLLESVQAHLGSTVKPPMERTTALPSPSTTILAPPRLSAREIMARTRARLAVKDFPAVGTVPEPVLSIRERLAQRLAEEKKNTSVEDDEEIKELSPSEVAAQAAEARLRKQALLKMRLAAAKVNKDSTAVVGDVDEAEQESADRPNVNAEAAEATLRKQAKLRVRLAAERRAAASEAAEKQAKLNARLAAVKRASASGVVASQSF